MGAKISLYLEDYRSYRPLRNIKIAEEGVPFPKVPIDQLRSKMFPYDQADYTLSTAEKHKNSHTYGRSIALR
jgi:hypothetical protein